MLAFPEPLCMRNDAMMTAEAIEHCGHCGHEMDQDCMGEARCTFCDPPCPCCSDEGPTCCDCGDFAHVADDGGWLPDGEPICAECLHDRFNWHRQGNGILQVTEYHGERVRSLWLCGEESADVERKLDAAQAEGDLLAIAAIWDEYEHLAETH